MIGTLNHKALDVALDTVYTFSNISSRRLKNTHLLRYAHPWSLRRTGTYVSFLRISRALHLDVLNRLRHNTFSTICFTVKGGEIMGAESLQQLIDLAKSLEEDNQKFYAGNNAAGTRLRKGLQEVKKLAQTMRNEVTVTKASRKG